MLFSDMKKLIITISCIFLIFCCAAETLYGRAIWIIDGDTFILINREDSKAYTVRLYGIDAPESKQPYGKEATLALIRLIGRKMVEVEVIDTDRYQRKVGKVYVGRKRKHLVNLEMVIIGAAWHYVFYAKDDKELSEAEEKARQKASGLWDDPDAIAPWEWRKLQKGQKYIISPADSPESSEQPN